MRKALILLSISALVGLGLRYLLPKYILFADSKDEIIDEVLKETLEGKATSKLKTDTLYEVKQATIQTNNHNAEDDSDASTLGSFFEKLYKLEQKKHNCIRIAYFGDSMEDADMLVMQIRHYFQSRFGGKGVGFVPITSPSASGRYTILHSFSDNWNKDTFLKRKSSDFHFGVSGETFYVGDTTNFDVAEVEYSQGGAYKETTKLINPLLFYGKRKEVDSTFSELPTLYVTTKNAFNSTVLKGNKVLNVVPLPNNQKSLNLAVRDCGTLPLYGVSFASKKGVIIDNLAVRGSSGLALRNLNTRLMYKFDKYLKYDLLILGYGTNVFSTRYKNYEWYARRMTKVINHLSKCFLDADVLVISMADKADKIDGNLATPSGLYEFISMQKKFAVNTNSSFFNLFQAMGGEGSMIEWVEAEPSLANKDYTHFNARGAEKAAKLFYNWFISKYEEYIERTLKKH